MMGMKRQEGADEAPGAPEWMVTFSDCMTLLLTFFVLLLSFSSFDEKVFWKLKVIFAKALPSVGAADKRHKDGFLHTTQIERAEGLDEGSEKLTLARGKEDNLKEETEPVDFRRRKVFVISSQKIFWGKGVAISSEGRDIIAPMASFLKEVPGRIVISENGWGRKRDSEEFGLRRAWAVMEYLTTKQGLDKKCFSISASSMVAEEDVRSGRGGRPEAKTERMLEIVILERSLYN